MLFIRSVLYSIDWKGLVLAVPVTALTVCVGLMVITPTIPAPWGSVIGALAVFGAGTLLNHMASWVQARFTLNMPSWHPATWSAGRRWYGPRQRVRLVDGQLGIALDWIEDDIYGAGIWVLVRSWPKADPFSGTAVAWYPLTALTPYLLPRLTPDTGNGTGGV